MSRGCLWMARKGGGDDHKKGVMERAGEKKGRIHEHYSEGAVVWG